MLLEQTFLLALLLTLVIEIPVLFVSTKLLAPSRYDEMRKADIFAVGVVCSTLTLPYLWFVLPPFLNAAHFLLEGEAVVTVVEALIISHFLRVGVARALFFSLLCNSMSYCAGLGFIRLI